MEGTRIDRLMNQSGTGLVKGFKWFDNTRLTIGKLLGEVTAPLHQQAPPRTHQEFHPCQTLPAFVVLTIKNLYWNFRFDFDYFSLTLLRTYTAPYLNTSTIALIECIIMASGEKTFNCAIMGDLIIGSSKGISKNVMNPLAINNGI